MNMRVWDIHPGYLSDRSLLGEHSESHALYSIITGQKRGFARHPETRRWTGHLGQLILRHNLLIKEMTLREFKHNSPLSLLQHMNENDWMNHVSSIDLPAVQFEILRNKYLEKGQKGRIPLPRNGTEFWAHHKYSVMARGYQYYKEVQQFMKNRQNFSIAMENDLIAKIRSTMEKEVSATALDNVILHLWGYFKKKSTEEEKKQFFRISEYTEKMDMLYHMAKKYRQHYLLHSTIFADFLPCL